jgi:hypothetical protein
MIVMTTDQQTVFDWITDERRLGWNPKPIPLGLEKFRHVRDQLVRAGLVTKTDTGRYVPA